jgi:hypothetical protein
VTYFGVLIGKSRLSDLPPVAVCLASFGVLLVHLMTSLPVSAQAQEARIALAQFTTAIENREPVDQVAFVENDVRKVFFYTDLRGLDGQTINHRWLHDGTVMADVSFEVRGPRWRVWSSKELLPDWIGDWTVEIVTGEGEVIAVETFTYTAPGA